MSVRSGESKTIEFTTRNGTTLNRSVADSLPTGTLYVNGAADAATVTVTSQTNGLYKAAFTLPTLAIGDVVGLIIVATVNGVTDQAKVWEDSKDVALDASGDVTFNNTTVGTVTTLTNLPAIPANWLTAAGIAASALNGKGDWNLGKTGYSLTQAFPANFSALGVTAGGKISGVVLVDTTTTNTDMRGTDNAALATQIPADFTEALFASAGVFSAGALANAPTGGGGGGDVNVISVNGTAFGGPNVPCVLADGVAHGGTPGASTATLALGAVFLFSHASSGFRALEIDAEDQVAVSIGGGTDNPGLQVSGGGSGQPAVVVSNSGTGAGMQILGAGDGMPALYLSNSQGDVVQIAANDAGHALSLSAAGAGKHDINLSGSGNVWDATNDRPVQVLSDRVMFAGTLGDQSLGDVVTVILPTGPAANGVLTGSRLRVTGGSGQSQERTIITWNGTDKAAGIDTSLNGAVQTSGDTFQVLYDHSAQFDSAGNAFAVATVALMTPQSLAQFFTADSTVTYADAVAGSVVKEIATNAAGSAPTVVQIRTEMDSNSTKLAHLDADTSSRLAAADYVAPLNAAGTRDAVGLASANLDAHLATIDADVLTRSTYAGGDTSGTTTLLSRVTAAVALASQIPAAFTDATFASVGVFSTGALANAPTGGGGGSDPWATAEPGAYSSGTFGFLVATDLPAILAKLNAAGSTILVVGTVPDDAGVMKIVRGDGYYLSDGTQIGPFTNTSGLAFDTATAFKFRVFKGASQSSGLLTDSDVAVTGSSGAWSFAADLTESQTTSMTHDQHGWEMVVTLLNGHTRTLARGTLDLSD